MNRYQYSSGKRVKRKILTDDINKDQKMERLERQIVRIRGFVKERLGDANGILRDELEVMENAIYSEEIQQNEYLRGHRDAMKEVSDFIKRVRKS